MCARVETSVSSHCGIGALNFGLATALMMSTPFFSGVVVFLAPGMNADATDPSCMAIIFILHDTIYHFLLACNQASWQSRLAAAEEACGSIGGVILWPPLLDGVIESEHITCSTSHACVCVSLGIFQWGHYANNQRQCTEVNFVETHRLTSFAQCNFQCFFIGACWSLLCTGCPSHGQGFKFPALNFLRSRPTTYTPYKTSNRREASSLRLPTLTHYCVHTIHDRQKKERGEPQRLYAHALLRTQPTRPPHRLESSLI